MMDPNVKLATMFIVALGTVGTTATAFADSEEEQSGIEIADEAVHDNTGLGSNADLAFHQSLCQAGISTEALDELGGCEALPPLGQSED